MNESELGRRIREHLNFGLRHLDREVLRRLEEARRGALGALEAQPAHAPAWQWAGAGHGSGGQAAVRRWLWLAMFVALLGGTLYWQQHMTLQEEEVDAALLADELPLDAYLDHGFQAWLERASQH